MWVYGWHKVLMQQRGTDTIASSGRRTLTNIQSNKIVVRPFKRDVTLIPRLVLYIWLLWNAVCGTELKV